MDKQCFKCGLSKSVDEFYKHPRMSDGRLGKFKDCTKSDVQKNYRSNRPKYQRYYKERESRPERKAQKLRTQAKSRAMSPEKYTARQAVDYAVRRGKLIRQPCEVCGCEKSQAHHEDYSRPLDVKWLCLEHHRIAHGRWVDEQSIAV